MQRFIPLLSAVLLFTIVATACQTLYIKPYVLSHSVSPLRGSGQTNADSQILQQKAFQDSGLLPIYGSSELSTVFIPEHPGNVFKTPEYPFSATLVGAGGNQSLIHSLHFSTLGNAIAGKKAVIILSAQWFTPSGLSSQYFERWYSRQQIYQTLDNPGLSYEVKVRLAARLLDFTVVKLDPILSINLYAVAHSNKFLMNAAAPLRYLQARALKEMDYVHAYRAIKNASQPSPETEKSSFPLGTNWEHMRQIAEEHGAKNTTNNSYGIYDEYWTKYIQSQYEKQKGSSPNHSYAVSPEYADLTLLTDILKELKAEPLFVIVPVHGQWYDYTGFPIEGRLAYYQKTKSIIQEKGFKVADFSAREYEKYFLSDVMHLGWKGWASIDEAIYKFYTADKH